MSSATASDTGRALVPYVPSRPAFRPSALAIGAGLLLTFVVGAGGSYGLQLGLDRWKAQANQGEAMAQTVHRLQDEVARLKSGLDTLRTTADAGRQDEAVRALKRSVDALKADLQGVRTADAAALQQLGARLDKADPAPRLTDITARLDRIERDPKAPDAAAPRLAELSARLDRIEKQAAAPLATGSIAAPAGRPATPAAAHPVAAVATPLPPAKPDMSTEARAQQPAKAAVVDAWVLRDVYDGVALVEARRGGLREIGPGEFLPGAGQVRSIERRGRGWIVMTSRGVIGADTF